MNAEQVLRSAKRPLTSAEIVSRVSDKNRRSVYKELLNLKNHNLIFKVEVRLCTSNSETGNPIVLYKWI